MFMDLNSYLCTRKEVYNDCYKENKNREELRVEVVKKITANKRNAQSFLKKAGIVSKSGELTKIYR